MSGIEEPWRAHVEALLDLLDLPAGAQPVERAQSFERELRCLERFAFEAALEEDRFTLERMTRALELLELHGERGASPAWPAVEPAPAAAADAAPARA